MKRIKHRDLTHYFLRQHQELPQAYLASCEKFFKSIKQRGLTKREERLGWITRGHEQQAPSNKRQAPSNKRLTAQGPYDINRIIKEK
jgi:hypothetical protein